MTEPVSEPAMATPAVLIVAVALLLTISGARPASAQDFAAPFPNVNTPFSGKGADLGAYETGKDLPFYGPRRLLKNPLSEFASFED